MDFAINKNGIAWENQAEQSEIIKQEVLNLSKTILIQLKTLIFEFFYSYKEYSVSNLKEYGLAEVLFMRALRFFKLEHEPEKEEEEPKEDKNNRKNRKQSLKKQLKKGAKKGIKIILFPFYFLYLILISLLKRKISKKKAALIKKAPKKKTNIYVNAYTE